MARQALKLSIKRGYEQMTYQWRFFEYNADPNEVGRCIEKLEKKHGAVTAEILLDSARSEKSSIHNMFEWDDAVAGEKYRLSQATKIILALAVVEEDPEKEQNPVQRAYVNVGTRREGKFISTMLAMSQQETRETVLRHALEELSAFQQKYKGLTELAGILDSIDQLKLAL